MRAKIHNHICNSFLFISKYRPFFRTLEQNIPLNDRNIYTASLTRVAFRRRSSKLSYQSQRGPHAFLDALHRFSPRRKSRKDARRGKRDRCLNGIIEGRIMQIDSNYPFRLVARISDDCSRESLHSSDVAFKVDVSIALPDT